MRIPGGDRIQRFDGTSWKKVEFGEAFPEQPEEDGGVFQLAPRAPVPGHINHRRWRPKTSPAGALTVEGRGQLRARGGTFTVSGGTGTCKYTGKTSTSSFTGSLVARGILKDKVTATSTTATKAIGAAQDLAGGDAQRCVDRATSTRPASSRSAGPRGNVRLHRQDGVVLPPVAQTAPVWPKDLAVVKLTAKAPGIYKWTDSLVFVGRADGPGSDSEVRTVLPGSPCERRTSSGSPRTRSLRRRSPARAPRTSESPARSRSTSSPNRRKAVVSGGAVVASRHRATSSCARARAAWTTPQKRVLRREGRHRRRRRVGWRSKKKTTRITRAAVENGATFSSSTNLDDRRRIPLPHGNNERQGRLRGRRRRHPLGLARDREGSDLGLPRHRFRDRRRPGTRRSPPGSALSSSLKADGEARGEDAAIGAAVGIAIFEPTTRAPPLDRNLTARP